MNALTNALRGLLFASILLPSLASGQVCLHPDFQVELLAGVPEIEHPSVVTCDDQGNLFVGEDPMDMRGPTTKEFDRIVYFQFNPDGSIRRKTVFAEGLSAVFGMIWHDQALYVMHAPHYSVYRDTDGDGVADESQQLADGFGPPAGIFGFNDHIVTGTRLGLDGYVYVSVGDKGVPLATGSDGSTVSLEGGGVIRMKLDGSELEVFSCGTRNHLDVAMDSLDNIFTYDNTDDGLGWWTRFTYHMPTGYYGYPFDYHPHADRHLPRISEHGGGSPVGAACYREAVWPARYRDAAFHCEWGKGKVQVFFPKREGAGFTATMEDFLVPAEGSDFRPQDVCFSPDGTTMYVADWNFGGWTQDRQLGRVYRVTYTGPTSPLEPLTEAAIQGGSTKALGHPSYHVRRLAQDAWSKRGAKGVAELTNLISATSADPAAKVHAIWAIYAAAERTPQLDVTAGYRAALQDDSAIVRAQAARAIGTQFAQQRWSTFSVSESVQTPFAEDQRVDVPSWVTPALLGLASSDPDASVRLQASVALGRLSSDEAMKPLLETTSQSDVYARFAAIQASRAIGDWEAALPLVTSTDEDVVRGTILAATGVADPNAVALLDRAIDQAPTTELSAAAVAAIGEVHHLRAPYESGWWGTRPAASKPQRPRTHAWEGTDQVLASVRRALHHPSEEVRAIAVGWQREWNDPEALEIVRALAATDPSSRVRVAIFELFAKKRDEVSVAVLAAVVGDAGQPVDVRQAAIDALTQIGGDTANEALARLIEQENAPAELLVSALQGIGTLQAGSARLAVQGLCRHPEPGVRAEAAGCLAIVVGDSAQETLEGLLQDDATQVRRAALAALAAADIQASVPLMLESLSEPELSNDAILALARLANRRAVTAYLTGLVNRNPQVREACARALSQLRLENELVNDLKALNARNELSPDVRRELGQLFATPRPIQSWTVLGNWSKEQALPELDRSQAPDIDAAVQIGDRELVWRQVQTDDAQGRFDPNQWGDPTDNAWALAYAKVTVTEPSKVNWQLGSDDQARVWINEELIYDFDGNRGWSAQQGQGEVELQAGDNQIWFLTGNSSGPWQFSLAIGAPDSELGFLYEAIPAGLDLAAFRQHVAENAGDAARGQKLFYDAQGVGCVKCHSVGQQGTSDIGPNLLGVGAKYPREELVRSILEPSNRIASGYEMTLVMTADGEILQGIVKGEEDDELIFANTQGEIIRLDPELIEAREKSPLSAMPNGLEKGLSLADFADLVAYIESLKETEVKD